MSKKDLPFISYEIIFYRETGKIVKSVKRDIKGVLNNGVVKKIAKEEGLEYDYWIFRKIE